MRCEPLKASAFLTCSGTWHRVPFPGWNTFLRCHLQDAALCLKTHYPKLRSLAIIIAHEKLICQDILKTSQCTPSSCSCCCCCCCCCCLCIFTYHHQTTPTLCDITSICFIYNLNLILQLLHVPFQTASVGWIQNKIGPTIRPHTFMSCNGHLSTTTCNSLQLTHLGAGTWVNEGW